MSAKKPSGTKVNVHVKKVTGKGKKAVTEWAREERELNHDDFAAFIRLHQVLDGVKNRLLHYYASGADPEERVQRLAEITTKVKGLPSLESGSECMNSGQCRPGEVCVGGMCVPDNGIA